MLRSFKLTIYLAYLRIECVANQWCKRKKTKIKAVIQRLHKRVEKAAKSLEPNQTDSLRPQVGQGSCSLFKKKLLG